MNIEELRGLLTTIQEDLDNVGGDKHIKAASARVRTNLGKIKTATADLRRELIALDKK